MAAKEAKLKIVVDAQDNTKGTFKSLNNQMGEVQSTTRSMISTVKVMAAAGAAAATAFAGLGVNIAADLQTARMGLITLLGSAEKADKTIARLKQEAQRTPFDLPGLTQATQLLSSVTKDGDKSINILLDIGEALAAMGKGQAELDRIIVNLQQTGAIGYASMVDIKQFAFAGIPIFEMLQKETGLTGEALEKFVSDGKVTFELLTQMFDKANDKGGQFFEAFKNQSGTFNQSFAALKDSFGIFAADVVTSTGLLQGLTSAMQVAANFLQNYREHLGTARDVMASFFVVLDEKTGLITYLKDAIANVTYWFHERLKPALDDLWVTLQPYKPFLDAMAQVFGTGLVIAIGLAITVVGGLAIGLIELLTWITKIVDYVSEKFLRIWDNITSAIAGTKGWVDALVDSLKTVLSLFSKVASIMPTMGPVSGAVKGLGKLIGVNDAIIAPNGNIITTHPDDYLIATKNPHSLGGSGVTVNINGGMYLSEDAAEKIGDLILGRLKLSNAL